MMPLSLWFLILTLPFCVWAAVWDLRFMRIPNMCTDLMAATFLVAGLVLIPDWADYGLRIALGIGVLSLGILCNALGLLGAGDAKFMAAAAPFVGFADGWMLLVTYTAALLVAVVAHRGARALGAARLAPDWVSWTSGKRFPMGLVFGLTLPAFFAAQTWGWPL